MFPFGVTDYPVFKGPFSLLYLYFLLWTGTEAEDHLSVIVDDLRGLLLMCVWSRFDSSVGCIHLVGVDRQDEASFLAFSLDQAVAFLCLEHVVEGMRAKKIQLKLHSFPAHRP